MINLIYDFTGSDGMKINYDENNSPVGVFLTLFDDILLNKFVHSTSLKQLQFPKMLEKSRYWKYVDKSELKNVWLVNCGG